MQFYFEEHLRKAQEYNELRTKYVFDQTDEKEADKKKI